MLIIPISYILPDRYHDILDSQLKVIFADEMLAQVFPEIEKTVCLIAKGAVPHCENVLLELLRKLASVLSGDGESFGHPANVLSSSPKMQHAIMEG